MSSFTAHSVRGKHQTTSFSVKSRKGGIRCPKCQFQAREGEKFCGQCGARLTLVCPSCQFENPPHYTFCGECGINLSTREKPHSLARMEKTTLGKARKVKSSTGPLLGSWASQRPMLGAIMGREIKTTRLHEWHSARGAKMAEFGGYEMPLWYQSGPREEHLAVLTRVGIFDTSHMAVVLLSGPGAFALLQLCFTKDLQRCIGKDNAPLSPGKCTYGAFLNDHGEVIDDSIVCQIGPDLYMAVVNAGMGGPVSKHLMGHRGEHAVEITDLTDRLGKVDVQGTGSARIIRKLFQEPEQILEGMKYFTFKGHFDAKSPYADAVRVKDGTPVILSRTGYTGEFGFEIFVDAEANINLWEMILEAGEEFGIQPCGLAARDSLRTGATLPLSHQDIGPWSFINNPWPFTLPYNGDRTGFTKDFIGRGALENIASPEYTYPFVGYDVRKVEVHKGQAVVLDRDGHRSGIVLSCVSEMGIGRHGGRIYSIASPDKPDGFIPRGLSCGFIKVKTNLATGEIVILKDARREIKVEIVPDIRPDRTAHSPMYLMIRS
jgi:aminomethyltransferase